MISSDNTGAADELQELEMENKSYDKIIWW